ncbi:MAG: hypothetical protein REI45_02445, partial [Propionicimonas sp.]|nr:hypothetical protein [Propionicimonas sp.]
HWAVPVTGEDVAWIDEERTVRFGALAGLEPETGRVLVRPSTPWRTLADAVLRPLLGGGSAVVVAGATDDAQLARIASSEKVASGLE